MHCNDKLDFNLQQAVRAFKECGAQHEDSAGVTVSFRFEGDLADIPANAGVGGNILWHAHVASGTLTHGVDDTDIDFIPPALIKQPTPKPFIFVQVR